MHVFRVHLAVVDGGWLLLLLRVLRRDRRVVGEHGPIAVARHRTVGIFFWGKRNRQVRISALSALITALICLSDSRHNSGASQLGQ